MDSSVESFFLLLSILLLLSLIGAKLSGKLGIPVLLFFLAMGMLAGSEGPGHIRFDNPKTVQITGVIALVFILFSGGLDTLWRTSKSVLLAGISLSTLGVMITTFLVGYFSCLILGLSLLEGLLLGATVSSTDATAVFTILGSKNMSLRGRLKPLLELESGSNDPMAVLLTIGILGLILNPNLSFWGLIPFFLKQMVIGTAVGVAAGKGMVYLINNSKFGYDGLYPVLSIALVLLSFGISQILGGSGFLTAYLAGIILGNSQFIHKRNLIHFHESLAWLMQIAMFFILGLQISPSNLLTVTGHGLLLSLFLMFIARPVSVFITLARSHFTLPEKTFISWVGLRGAAPIILATYPLLAGLPNAPLIFNLVFFIALTSILLQGTTLLKISKWLKLEEKGMQRTPFPIEFHPTSHLKSEILEFEVDPSSAAVGKSILELNLPKKVLIVLIHRKNETFAPSGTTRLEAKDRMIILAEKNEVNLLRNLLENPMRSSA